MPKTINTPSKTTLRKAAKLLQAAHDLIEINGFDINTFDGHAHARIAGSNHAPMCYIGTMRHVAGLTPTPKGPASDGDGPELVHALATMDRIAKRRMDSRGRRDVQESWTSITDDVNWSIGRFVEAFGFEIEDRAMERYPEDPDKAAAYQTEYALKLLRKALTEIYG